jgi:hypothetical protein
LPSIRAARAPGLFGLFTKQVEKALRSGGPTRRVLVGDGLLRCFDTIISRYRNSLMSAIGT